MEKDAVRNQKFSKKHYQAVASELVSTRPAPTSYATVSDPVYQKASRLQWEYDVEQLATMFERDNPRFNREHFMAVVRGERAVNSRPGGKK